MVNILTFTINGTIVQEGFIPMSIRVVAAACVIFIPMVLLTEAITKAVPKHWNLI